MAMDMANEQPMAMDMVMDTVMVDTMEDSTMAKDQLQMRTHPTTSSSPRDISGTWKTTTRNNLNYHRVLIENEIPS